MEGAGDGGGHAGVNGHATHVTVTWCSPALTFTASSSSASPPSSSSSMSSSSSSVLRAGRRADLSLLQSVSAAPLCGGPERARPAAAHRRRCLKPKDQKFLFFRLKIAHFFMDFLLRCVCAGEPADSQPGGEGQEQLRGQRGERPVLQPQDDLQAALAAPGGGLSEVGAAAAW